MKDSIKKHPFLSQSDPYLALDIISKAVSCETHEDLRLLFNKLRDIIPFEYAICLFASLGPEGIREQYEVMNLNFPEEWIRIYGDSNYYKIDPVFQENFRMFGLQLWSDTYNKYKPPDTFISLAEDFRLKKGYTYGARNYKNTRGSLFSFSGDTILVEPRTHFFLHHLSPHFHQALERISLKRKREGRSLSRKELEVLKWFIQGKTSWETSVIMGISERTVRFYAETIIQKLDASSRTHAVAIALHLGLIELD